MKVFVWAGSLDQVEIMKDWGTRPVSLEPADIFSSLSTGMIDVISATPFSANAGQYAVVAKNMLEINWTPLAGGAIVHKRVWDKVPADCRQDLLKIAEDLGKAIKASGRKESEEAVEAMKRKQGLKVCLPSPQVNEEWRQAVKAVYPKIRGTMVPVEMFDKVERLLRERRTQQGGGG
jgi:TRAP-type C4-dicarboxylate transport system substrate-binding protein